ncbi:hypothetical protein IMX07_16970 [bacterium]|nr:hypothetical protein [bacterium]
MSAYRCCQGVARGPAAAPRATPARTGFARWLAPAALFALTPKCPLCIAAYLTAATGIGVSASSVTWMRTAAIMIGAGALGYLAASAMGRRRRARVS